MVQERQREQQQEHENDGRQDDEEVQAGTGTHMPGANTSEEELAGVQPVLVTVNDGAVQLDAAVAPAGSVRLTVMNQSAMAIGLNIAASGDDRSTIEQWSDIAPGDVRDAVIDLEAGDYILTALDVADHRAIGSATLVVQPREGIADAAERAAALRTPSPEA